MKGREAHTPAMSFSRGNFSNNATYDLNVTGLGPANFTTNSIDNVAVEMLSAFNVYYTPFLILLGSVGNLVSVFVFYSSKLRLQSTSQYLSALAISDTVFLLQLLPPWLSALHVSHLFHQNGFCQIFVYVSYVTCCLSAWLVVAFTVERFVAVLYPLQRTAVCTIKRARSVIISLACTALILNIPVLRFATPVPNDCNIDFEYMDYAEKFNLVDTFVSFTLPLLVIVVLNAWIMVGVVRLERTRQQLLKAEEGELSSHQHARRTFMPPCPRSQQRVTRMLLIVSSVFVILNLPAYTMRILIYAYPMAFDETDGPSTAVQQIALMFFNTNFGINFFLYCLSGQNFRRALRNTLPWLRGRAQRAIALRRIVSSRPPRASSVSSNPSFVSNCTEATAHCATFPTPASRRRRQEPYITRWTFDNSGQRQAMQQHQGSQHRPLYSQIQHQTLHRELEYSNAQRQDTQEQTEQSGALRHQHQIIQHQVLTHDERPCSSRLRSIHLRHDLHERSVGPTRLATRQQTIQRESNSREGFELKIFMGQSETTL